MSISYLETPIEFLKGVGPQRADMLKKELEIFTFHDLLHFFPFRYVDRSKFYKVREVRADLPYIQIRGYISNIELHGDRRTTRMTAVLSDETGSMQLVWFRGFKWLKGLYKPGVEYVVFGKPNIFGRKINLAHPEIEPCTADQLYTTVKMQPVYNSTEKLRARGLDSRGINKLIKTLLPAAVPYIEESLPPRLMSTLKLPGRKETISDIHFPSDELSLKRAVARLKFEELFYIQLSLLRQKLLRLEKSSGHIFSKIGDLFNGFYHDRLSFSLTSAQKKGFKRDSF